jgi:hypothetical protein
VINEPALRDALLALTEVAKRQAELLVSLTAEVAAVRDSMKGLDPTFDDTFAMKRQQVLQKQLPSYGGLIFSLEEITRKLKSGEVC